MNASVSGMPARIGRFHIRSMLGRGAMGIVYLGHDEEIDRLVAIKLIRADLLDTEERDSYLKRFRNEAKIAGRCMHANIVGLYDFAMHDGNPYLVMEHVNGVGLQQFFPRGSQRSVDEVIGIALQVLDALNYAHARGIVHRDIKPANILMSSDRSLKITDFGISRLTSMELTATPLLIGTPSYMSPEQCIGSALDGRNDLFSLGCVLHELLTGERTFAGVNYTESIFAIVNKPHAPLDRFRADLPPGLAGAIDRALAKKPDDRFSDAASFARTLDDIARAAGVTRANVPLVIIDTVGGVRPSAPVDAGGRGPGEVASDDDPESGTAIAPFDEVTIGELRAAAPPTLDTSAPAVVPEAGFGASVQTGRDPSHDLDTTLIRPPPPVPSPEKVAEPAMVSPVPAYEGATGFGDVDAVDDGFVPKPVAITEHALDPAERARIAFCLADVLGPIAPVLVRRVETPGMSAAALTEALAGFVRHRGEQSRFLDQVGGRRTVAVGSGRRP